MKKLINTPLIWGFFMLVGIAIGFTLGDDSTSQEHQHAPGKETIWTCSMDPQVQASEPGSCPICGMDLIPASSSGGNSLSPDEVKLTPRALALAQIQTSVVSPLSGSAARRNLVGRVTKNEDQTKVITAWFGGRIEKLKVSSVGERVKRNQTIAYVYSPGIYAAHRDLMTAQSQIKSLSNADAFARNASLAALDSAKMRLRLLGLKESEVTRMANAKKAWTRIPIRSPFSGTVVQKRVSEGAYVKEGDALLEISNLNSVWVELDAYATDLPLIQVGQSVKFSVDSIPNEVFDGKVSFIEPFVDSATRTGTVRVELENDGKLKPGQYVTASLEGKSFSNTTLVIPRSAPLYAGKRAVVYIEKQTHPEPVYVAKSIKLGQVIGDNVIVLKGLKIGERVVSHGAFTLDADLQIRGGLSLLARPDDRSAGSELEIPDGFLKTIAPELVAYLRIQESLAEDDLTATKKGSTVLQSEISKVDTSGLNPNVRKIWDRMQSKLSNASTRISGAKDIKGARDHFQALSLAMADILKGVGNPLSKSLSFAFCPMAFNNLGAHWFQLGTNIRNSYFGETMLACGTIEQTLEPFQKLGGEAPEKVEPKKSKVVKSKKAAAKSKKSSTKSSPKKVPASAPATAPTTAPQTAPTTQSQSAPTKSPESVPATQPTSATGTK